MTATRKSPRPPSEPRRVGRGVPASYLLAAVARRQDRHFPGLREWRRKVADLTDEQKAGEDRGLPADICEYGWRVLVTEADVSHRLACAAQARETDFPDIMQWLLRCDHLTDDEQMAWGALPPEVREFAERVERHYGYDPPMEPNPVEVPTASGSEVA